MSMYTRLPVPAIGNIRDATTAPDVTMALSIKQRKSFAYYNSEDGADVGFQQASTLLADLHSLTSTFPERYTAHLLRDMVAVVYGSNLIERAGILDHLVNSAICRDVLVRHRTVFYGPRDDNFNSTLRRIVDTASNRFSRRERSEVANHAAAFAYPVNQFIDLQVPLSDELIKATHSILAHELDAENGSHRPWRGYVGIYRWNDELDYVFAGNAGFVRPSLVVKAMGRFVEEVNQLLKEADGSGEIDLFWIAAHVCGDFLNIHPFIDGNGRMCRLLMNVILLRYAGIIVPIGDDQEERGRYLDIARRRSREEVGNGELATFVLKKAVKRMEETEGM